jgi:phosphoserine phosphatase
MNGNRSTIAVVFDFDDTLVPDSTTQLLETASPPINVKTFWKQDFKKLVQCGYDPTLAYLKLLLENVGIGKPLGPMSIAGLRRFGRSLDTKFYPGLPKLFDDLRRIVKRAKNIDIEFFIVSGGLQDVIEGSKTVKKYFKAVYGCCLSENSNGVLSEVKRSITFTEKTRYLFEINKGLDPHRTRRNPYLVNEDVPSIKRPIPFENLIYVGDGLTDIPCFSLVQRSGGIAFGVFNPNEQKSAKRALLKFLKPRRVVSAHAPKYGPDDDLGSFLRAAVAERCTRLKVQQHQA